jgi:hypothetical protein
VDRGEKMLSGWALMAHGLIGVSAGDGDASWHSVPVLVNVLVQHLEAVPPAFRRS